jgi:cytochrome c biogenesis protein CcmG/thiol:disulfide interchange protein DsbE
MSGRAPGQLEGERVAPAGSRRWLFALPLGGAAAIGAALALGLGRDPQVLPSALAGKPAPDFTLPPLEGRDSRGFARADLGGRPMLVNVWASWCVPCRIEHPFLVRLKAEHDLPIHGINYKDRPEAALGFLAEMGDPYTYVGADRQGRVAIDWGVYGVPETYLIDPAGRIAHRVVGPLQPRDLDDSILPLLARMRG